MPPTTKAKTMTPDEWAGLAFLATAALGFIYMMIQAIREALK
jgi:hypothetical protein